MGSLGIVRVPASHAYGRRGLQVCVADGPVLAEVHNWKLVGCYRRIEGISQHILRATFAGSEGIETAAMKLAFYRGISFVSKLIQWQSRGPYSHVGVLHDDGSIMEAWENGGVLHNASISTKHDPNTPVDIYSLPLMSAAQEERFRGFLLRQLGKKYDYKGVLRFLPASRLIHGEDSSMSVDREKWFCSELVYASSVFSGVPLLCRAETNRVHPTMLSYSPLINFIETVYTS